MPEMTGMEFINALEKDIEIILITSEEKYAVEAFEKHVTDYLVKPIEYARFIQAVQKAQQNVENKRANTVNRREFFVRSDAKIVRIPYEKILFVEALADYVIIQTEAKKHIVHFTMKGIFNRLPDDEFVRTHRSFIVNLNKIEALEDNSILIGEKYIPIGASYKDAFMDRLNFL
jgi:DNA-binding LytR/AlgR family response regulator